MKKKNINEKIFKDFFFFNQTPSYSAKILYESDEIKNDEVIKHINNRLIELRNSINSK